MQLELFSNANMSGGKFSEQKQPKKAGKKRGRKPLPYIPKPVPTQRVIAALQKNRLNFDGLKRKTKLSDDKLGLALSSLIINTRAVRSYTLDEIRFYELS